MKNIKNGNYTHFGVWDMETNTNITGPWYKGICTCSHCGSTDFEPGDDGNCSDCGHPLEPENEE